MPKRKGYHCHRKPQLAEARRQGIYEHYYSEHMAQGWCTWYICPAEGCYRIFRVSRNMHTHLCQVAGWPDRKDKDGKKAAAPLPCKNEKERIEQERHSGLVSSVLSMSIENVLNAMWGPDYACQGYKACMNVTQIERETSDDGQYLRSIIMLNKVDEKNVKVGETQTYGNPSHGVFSIQSPESPGQLLG